METCFQLSYLWIFFRHFKILDIRKATIMTISYRNLPLKINPENKEELWSKVAKPEEFDPESHSDDWHKNCANYLYRFVSPTKHYDYEVKSAVWTGSRQLKWTKWGVIKTFLARPVLCASDMELYCSLYSTKHTLKWTIEILWEVCPACFGTPAISIQEMWK